MNTASSASSTWRASRSASEYTATVAMPIFFAVLMTRQAISPRLAIRIFLNMIVGLAGSERDVAVLAPRVLELLVRSIASERQMRLRVSCGWITSSMKPRAPATKGFAKRALYSASRAASLAGSPLSSRKMISTAPLAPITAISAFGQAKLTSPRRCLELITS
jgi:hypothetical protein